MGQGRPWYYSMPMYTGKNKLIIAWYDLFNYLKVRALKSIIIQNITKFLFKDIIYKYKVFIRLVTNGD